MEAAFLLGLAMLWKFGRRVCQLRWHYDAGVMLDHASCSDGIPDPLTHP